MKETVNVRWDGNMAFTAEINDYKVKIDADPEFGGQNNGPKPKPLLLASLGGCTAMDVVSILNKMRVFPEKFQVETEAELTEEHPKKFLSIVVKYRFNGKDLPLEKLQKAIQLSEEKYCGVSATLKPVVKISSEIWINEERVA